MVGNVKIITFNMHDEYIFLIIIKIILTTLYRNDDDEVGRN